MAKPYYRGELYYADLGKGIGSEQEGYRPVVIIQNNTGNKYSPTVIVAPVTTPFDNFMLSGNNAFLNLLSYLNI